MIGALALAAADVGVSFAPAKPMPPAGRAVR
jgi:hypothetical protein